MSSFWSRLERDLDGFLGRVFHGLANEPWHSEHPELSTERWPKIDIEPKIEPSPDARELPQRPSSGYPEIELPARDGASQESLSDAPAQRS